MQSDGQSTGWEEVGRWEEDSSSDSDLGGCNGRCRWFSTTLGKMCSLGARLKLPTLPSAERGILVPLDSGESLFSAPCPRCPQGNGYRIVGAK